MSSLLSILPGHLSTSSSWCDHYAGVWAVHNLVISSVLVMKARWLGMWQCQCCGCSLHYSGPGQCDALWRAAGECYSHVTGQPWHAVITSWHISHTTLLSTFHGTLLIEVEEAFMFSLVRCPSRGEDQQWWSPTFSMVKVWPFWHYPGVVWCWCDSC